MTRQLTKKIWLPFVENELTDVPLNIERAKMIAKRKFKNKQPIHGPTHGAIGRAITWLYMEERMSVEEIANMLKAPQEDVEDYIEWYHGSKPRRVSKEKVEKIKEIVSSEE